MGLFCFFHTTKALNAMVDKWKRKFLAGNAWKGKQIVLRGVKCSVTKVVLGGEGKHIVWYNGHAINKSGYFYADEDRWSLVDDSAGCSQNSDRNRDLDEVVLTYLRKWFGPVKQADYNSKIELHLKGSGRVDPGEEWGRSSFSQIHNGTAEDGTLMFFRRQNLGRNNMVSEMGLDWWFELPDVTVQAGKNERGILSDSKVDEGQPEKARQMAECCERDIRQIFRCVV